MEIMPELDRRGAGSYNDHISPREGELIKFRDNHTSLVFKLITGEEFEGAVRWYDTQAIRLVQADRSEVTIYLHSVAYYKTRA